MDIMSDAFKRAGFSQEDTQFLSACRDLMRLALNQEADPHRAAMRWRGMTGMLGFQQELFAFAVAVKEQMQPSDADEDQRKSSTEDGQAGILPSAPEGTEGEDHSAGVQSAHVPPSVTPSERRARLQLEDLKSAYQLTDKAGNRTSVEGLFVRALNATIRSRAKDAVTAVADVMVTRNIYRRAPQVPRSHLTVGETMTGSEIREAVIQGKQEAYIIAKSADQAMEKIAAKWLSDD